MTTEFELFLKKKKSPKKIIYKKTMAEASNNHKISRVKFIAIHFNFIFVFVLHLRVLRLLLLHYLTVIRMFNPWFFLSVRAFRPVFRLHRPISSKLFQMRPLLDSSKPVSVLESKIRHVVEQISTLAIKVEAIEFILCSEEHQLSTLMLPTEVSNQIVKYRKIYSNLDKTLCTKIIVNLQKEKSYLQKEKTYLAKLEAKEEADLAKVELIRIVRNKSIEDLRDKLRTKEDEYIYLQKEASINPKRFAHLRNSITKISMKLCTLHINLDSTGFISESNVFSIEGTKKEPSAVELKQALAKFKGYVEKDKMLVGSDRA